MSTRSFIARKTRNGFEGVYCHWDGYVEHNGSILLKHYNDPEKVAKLLSYGDMSSLSESVGEKHDFEDREQPWTTYYGRDRGEAHQTVKTKRYKSLEQLKKYAEEVGCEYFYLFNRGCWQCSVRDPQFFGMSDGSPFSELMPLRLK